MIDEILEDLEDIMQYKWAPSMTFHNKIGTLINKIKNRQIEVKIENSNVIETEEEISKPKKKKISDYSSIYIPNGGVDSKKDKESSNDKKN